MKQETGQDPEPVFCVCWACLVNIQIPLVGETPVACSAFQCGHCGAVNESYTAQQERLARRQNQRSLCVRIWKAVLKLQGATVVFVLGLIASIVIPGAVFLIPALCTSPTALVLDHGAAMLLTFLVVFNFFASILCSFGTVEECFDLKLGAGETVRPGAYDNHRYCWECKQHKPPGTHHCSTCCKCVVDQDHHCPFVGNCIGRVNMRNFLHFKLWTLLAMLFSLAHCVILFSRASERRNLSRLFERAWSISRSEDHSLALEQISLFIGIFLTHCPFYFLATLYVCVMSVLIFGTVGTLFVLTIRHLLSNTSSVRVPKPSVSISKANQPITAQSLLQGQPTLRNRTHSDSTSGVTETGSPYFTVAMDDLTLALGGRGFQAWLLPHWGPWGTFGNARLPALPGAAKKQR